MHYMLYLLKKFNLLFLNLGQDSCNVIFAATSDEFGLKRERFTAADCHILQAPDVKCSSFPFQKFARRGKAHDVSKFPNFIDMKFFFFCNFARIIKNALKVQGILTHTKTPHKGLHTLLRVNASQTITFPS